MGDHELRISDAEREDVIGILREQTTAGRLTLEEFEERLGEVYDARTTGALEHVLRELPVQPAPSSPPTGVRRAADRTEEELRGRWLRRVRGELVGFAMPNVVCNTIWFLGDFERWWPGWVLLGTGIGIVNTLARGFDPDAERVRLAAQERKQAMAEIEMRRVLGRGV